MAQSLRQIKARIRSVENVKKITRAMEMISVAKFKAAENQLLSSARFSLGVEDLLKKVLSCAKKVDHPLLENRRDKKRIALCLITSDTGLCGVYNNSVIRLAEKFINETGREKIKLIAAGKKGFNHFKKEGMSSPDTYLDLHGHYSVDTAGSILKNLVDIFLSGEADDVYVAYMYFESSARHKPVIEKFLNIESGGAPKTEYIFEPNADSILEELLPVYLSNKVESFLLNAFVSEHAARMNAMGESTENAKDLLENLILSRNKVRQANITEDLIEISSAAEVLM